MEDVYYAAVMNPRPRIQVSPQDYHRAILVWREYETSLYWLIHGSSEELDLLQTEVEYYNRWINQYLLTGLAPLYSYAKSRRDLVDDFIFVKDRRYQPFFGVPIDRAVYGIQEFESGSGFELIYLDASDADKNYVDPEYIQELRNEYANGNLTFEPALALHDLIVEPWSPGLGYRILPMTQRLMDRMRTRFT